MLIYILIGITGVALCLGIFLILKGLRSSAETDGAEPIPITNINEIKEIQSSKKEISTSPFTKLKQENQNLTEALKQEMTSKDPITLSEEEKQQLEEKSRKLTDAQKSIENLTEENHKLQKKFDELKPVSEEKMNQAADIISESQAKIEELKQKPTETSTEGLQEKNTEIETLQAKLNQTADAIEVLEKNAEESEANQIQNNENECKLKALEEELNDLQTISNQKIHQAADIIESQNKKIQDLETQKSSLEKKITEQSESNTKKFSEKETLENKILELDKTNADLQTQLNGVKEYNVHLLEKEKRLDYDLSKSRAQSMGLEKICEDFKVKIEASENH